jgi:hypothetical protein
MELQSNAALGVPFATFRNIVYTPRITRTWFAHVVGAAGPNYFGNKLGDSRAHEDYRERRFERSFKERRLIN